MKFTIHAEIKLSQRLEDLVRERLNKLETYYQRTTHAVVYLKEKQGPNNMIDKEVQIELHVPGPVLFASGVSDTYEKALSLAAEKMRKQLVRYKEALNQKR